jgi:ATP-dependent protease ClpP protease subunit
VPPIIPNLQENPNNKEEEASGIILPVKLFVYFIAPVNSYSISSLIKGIDEKVANNNIKEINLFINSGGGDTSYGIAAYKYLKNLDINLKTYNLSAVHSSASFLYCAGNERYSTPGSSFLLHNINAKLDNHDMDEVILRGELMKIEKKDMIKIYKKCLKNNEELVNSIFNEGIIISTPNDVSIGLSKETIPQIPTPRKGDIIL